MAIVEFFEKPGCQSNTRQKALLRDAGNEVAEHNLLTEPWTPALLRPYFGKEPVSSWFNPSAPAIKQGEIQPERLSEQEALAKMCASPLLIKRPLLRVGDRCCSGFESAALSFLGLDITPEGHTNRCARDSAHPAPSCPSPLVQGREPANIEQ
ncbi:ArsC/Spx/MgsR family protein [Candidatus Methylospira mobilis]|uniref:ArsC/Spx/MgsR family protein n=1 Tax=Candidatus Methylospira mobilis TaxID=1808979 RepID=UPI0028E6FEF6|nr:ArsC/Spx/MgsR family protein [Candidatus Methylospira mobilis]WNV05307.1 ArsC/Spx/MgsR family protein [Candidatus Methylospira mobilis]